LRQQQRQLKRKTQTKKTSNCSTVQMKRLHVLINTEREKNFSALAEMQEHMAEQAASQTKKPADESSDTKEER
jgi:hypothetical protein